MMISTDINNVVFRIKFTYSFQFCQESCLHHFRKSRLSPSSVLAFCGFLNATNDQKLNARNCYRNIMLEIVTMAIVTSCYSNINLATFWTQWTATISKLNRCFKSLKWPFTVTIQNNADSENRWTECQVLYQQQYLYEEMRLLNVLRSLAALIP